MEEMYHLCLRHVNCRVRLHTRYGQYFDGVIVNVDENNVYLRTSGGVRISAWYGPGNDILTLSLFTLLAIALI
ncbi:hypothetical protein D3C73_687710 [compost metagenome]